MTASHLDFYTEHKISPVRQDILDLQSHFERRGSLYRMLGILPVTVRGARVLEVGPGSGHNAVYTASLRPSRYLLVEGNETGIEQMRALFADYGAHAGGIEIVQARVEDWQPDEQFDIVLCEGVLSGVPNPEEILSKLASATAPGGILVTTCVDHLSHFSETIRRAFAQKFVSSDDSVDEKVGKILPIMEPHLRTLRGMSRRLDDWVLDNLIHPGSIIPLVNIPETIVILASQCDYLGGSPSFVTDWRWYKSLVGEGQNFNKPAIEQYWNNAHNLMDYRVITAPRDPEVNQRLYGLCTSARAMLERYEHTRNEDLFDHFTLLVGEIADDLRSDMPETATGLDEARALLAAPLIDSDGVASARAFGGLFGRGQQYISFTRRADSTAS